MSKLLSDSSYPSYAPSHWHFDQAVGALRFPEHRHFTTITGNWNNALFCANNDVFFNNDSVNNGPAHQLVRRASWSGADSARISSLTTLTMTASTQQTRKRTAKSARLPCGGWSVVSKLVT